MEGTDNALGGCHSERSEESAFAMTDATPPPAGPRDAEWKTGLAQLRARERRLRQVARILGLEPDSPRAVVIREFLLGEIFRLAFEKSRSPNAMLQELHQALKAVPVEASGKKKKGMNPVEQGREIRRRWRALYGLDTPPEVDGESDRTG